MKIPSPKISMESKSMWKDMLMTIVATSISIVLTFGTGQWMENKKKKDDGRQMAMMVISDIDENTEAFNRYAKWEEKQLDLAKYVESHLDEINQLSKDTLLDVWNYIIDGDIYMIDDSKERIFNSSQDTWKNIDNALFINIVQSFYQERRICDEQFKDDVAFRFPLSGEEEYSRMVSTSHWGKEEIAAVLKELIPSRKVQLYFDYSPVRSRHMYSIVSQWQQKSDQLKFIMGITDEELQEYLNKQQRTGDPITDKQLVGTWTSPSAIGNTEESIEFKRDHRFVHLFKQFISNTIYSGKLIYERTMEGTWRIEGDSLFRVYESDVLRLDKSNIEYTEDHKEEVEDYISRYEEKIAQRNEKSKKEGSQMGHRSNTAFIDRSGSKIELGRTDVNEEGEEENYTSYMMRLKN